MALVALVDRIGVEKTRLAATSSRSRVLVDPVFEVAVRLSAKVGLT